MMSNADEKKLRNSIILSLHFSGAMPVTALRQELERVHFIAATAVAVRGALLWLEQMGLVRVRDDRALLTEMGNEVGALRMPFPD